MNEKKKIALLAASWDEKMIADLVKGVKKSLSGLNWDIHVMLCFPAFGVDNPDNFGNYNIFSLINHSHYEGILVAANVIHGFDMIKAFFPELLDGKRPVVFLDQAVEGVTSVVANGTEALYRLVSHLIEKHKCNTFNYVGGAKDHPDNQIRKAAFLQALKDHGIEPDERRMRDFHFVEDDGKEAYNLFKLRELHLPDAVVCANDAMAVGYCQAAEADGYYPPTDFLITGYDNDLNSIEFAPQITSVDHNAAELGYQGCEALLKKIAGEEVPPVINYPNALMFRGSCGCYSEEEKEKENRVIEQRVFFNTLRNERRFYQMLGSLRQNLALATTESNFNYFLHDTLKNEAMYGFAFCVNQEVYFSQSSIECTWKTGFDHRQYVVLGVKDKKRLDDKRVINTKRLYPDYLNTEADKTHVYMFAPIHKFGQNIGYIVFVDAEEMLGARYLLNLTSSISNAYSNLRNLLNLQKLNKWLDGVYTMDATTNLYNRFGYMKVGYEMFAKNKAYGKPLIVVFMDMDHLKYINDTYGHSQGDIALLLFAKSLKKVAGEKMIAIRYGGDEFLIVGPVEDVKAAEKFIEKLEKEFEATNQREKLPYKVEASIGYLLTDPKGEKDLDDYVEEADTLMYENKKKNKRDRGSNYFR